MFRAWSDPATHIGLTPPESCIDPALIQQSATDADQLIDPALWASVADESYFNIADLDPAIGIPNQSSAPPPSAHFRDSGSNPDLVLPSNNGAIRSDLNLNLHQAPAGTRASHASTGMSSIVQGSSANNTNFPSHLPDMQRPNNFEENEDSSYQSKGPYYNLPAQNAQSRPFQLNNSMAGVSRITQQHSHLYPVQGTQPNMLNSYARRYYGQQTGQPHADFNQMEWNGGQAQIAGQYSGQMRRMRTPIPEISPKTIPAEDASTPLLRKRARNDDDTGSQSEPSRIKRECLDCGKSFFQSKDPWYNRCSRCHAKHVKNNADPTIYEFDATLTLADAMATLYPVLEPINIARDDVQQESQRGAHYMRLLVEAVSNPYTSNGSTSKDNTQRLAQQAKMNKKPYDSQQYTSDLVNKRLHLLYQTALSYHAGGQVYYDIGGDNSGYGEDKTLIFSARLNKLIALLTTNKDIAMDVIEGRGVTALVLNPNKYERRKRDNKKSNDTKQDLQNKGKELLEHEASMSRVGTSVQPEGAWESVEGTGEAEVDLEVLRQGEMDEQPHMDNGEFDGYAPAWH